MSVSANKGFFCFTFVAIALAIRYDEDAMPAAVIAADLAVSTDTRERSAGLRALEELRRGWLAAH